MLLQTQRSIVKIQVCGLSDLFLKEIRKIGALPSLRELLWPNLDVTEGIMALAEDKRSEATLLIGVS